MALLFVVLALIFAWLARDGKFDSLFYYEPEPVYESRQQQRHALREIANTAVGGAPIDRRTRRRAASDIAHSFKR